MIGQTALPLMGASRSGILCGVIVSVWLGFSTESDKLTQSPAPSPLKTDETQDSYRSLQNIVAILCWAFRGDSVSRPYTLRAVAPTVFRLEEAFERRRR